jgi:hypothetical protein
MAVTGHKAYTGKEEEEDTFRKYMSLYTLTFKG